MVKGKPSKATEAKQRTTTCLFGFVLDLRWTYLYMVLVQLD